MHLSIFLVLFLLLIVYLLVAPIVIYLDTTANSYYLKLAHFVKISLESDSVAVLKICMQFFFFKFYFYPLRFKSSKKIKKSKKTTGLMQKRRAGLNNGYKILKTFKVKKLLINIDTGDCILNAKLYSVFAVLNYNFGSFKINFTGRNQMVLCIQNRPFNIIKTFINN